MSKQIYVNIITKDLTKSTEFYQAIGFVKNQQFSGDTASAMEWSENIIFMILTEEFAKNFDDGKVMADQKKSVSAFYALTCESKEEVNVFCEKAKNNGGRVYHNKFNEENASEFMYSLEVEDPDGYILEPFFMDLSKFPEAQ
jgi:uncharacterized protein